MPTSIEAVSPESAPPGTEPVPKTEQGQFTLTTAAGPGVCRLPLSSTALDSMAAVGLPCATHVKVQFVVPVAGSQVLPPSVDTSTPATTPPPASPAVPVIVTVVPSEMLAPAAGDVIVDVGAVVSVDAVAAVSPEISVEGCAPMSANRLTVTCCMVESDLPDGFALSRPHDHWTVPAPNTSAPLGARYSVRW